MSPIGVNEQTPREIVSELDKYIVGQHAAKRSVAIALRNRWRSRQLDDEMREDIIPKNILMIGSTGVGKTEIARRLARLVRAPFLKVEATKFTEVGYVGRDVESIVRDLVETAVRMVRQQKIEEVQEKAKENAEERLLDVFVQPPKKTANPLGSLFSSAQEEEKQDREEPPKYQAGREWVRKRLHRGELEDDIIEIEIEENARPMDGMFAGSSFESMSDNLQSMIGKLMPKNHRKRKVTVAQARKLLAVEEADKLIDMDAVAEEAVRAAEYSGIVFLDEIDKVAVSGGRSTGADVSREGVQRDILPIVEGSTVVTKYGPVKTDHILFIAAGAFHIAKPSDLIPELQGRFPIRVELQSLVKEDFKRILTEPKNALIKQYAALLHTEGISLKFSEDAIERLAEMAETVNEQTEDIGARRLYTLLEKLLENLSFDAPDLADKEIVIDTAYVDRSLADIAGDQDVSRFIL
ncbi:ATP-dependent protease ATPase subunit HslU [uncultured Selenomonas sp.]|uniref:ATP-dependent protease ATPase subunit HslU n=1 Tax=uncultured Selenomonas sp. TaxID=159275 RepID=UPI0028D3596A|nr:ATP-dependent protease ATPase subunit HslU [uncultured Selenomonas sp.]